MEIQKNLKLFLKNKNYKMTFSADWCYQLGLKGTSARSASLRPCGHPLVPSCGTTETKRGPFSSD
jgi:hypothetical protein